MSAPPVRESGQDLSTKITMVVFWGLVIVGLGFSALLLSSTQKDTIEKRGAIADSLAFRISALHPDKDLSTMFSVGKLKDIVRTYDDVGIEIYHNGKLRDFVDGHVRDGSAEVLVRPLLFISNTASHYELRVLFPNYDDVLHAERKKLLIVLGCMLLSFGVFLKLALEKVLKKPIEKMVEVAQNMTLSSEKTYVSFDENRNDELGYLARFMNEAMATMREHERQAWHAKELAEVTLESINDGVVTTDRNGKIDFMNPSAEILLGRRLGDVRSLPITNVMHLVNTETGMVIHSPVNTCLSNGRSINIDTNCALINKNGMQIPVAISVAAINDRREKALGVVLTFHKTAT